MDFTACPQPGCDRPAELLEHTVLESTDGPIEHARLVCLDGHRFFMPTVTLSDRLPNPSRAMSASGAAFRRLAQ